MIVLNIVLLIFVSMLVSFIVDKDIEDTIPPVIFAFLLILYGVAILGKSHHSYQGSLILAALVWVLYIYRSKRLLPPIKDIKDKLITPAFIVYICLLAAMYFGFSGHFVMVWDDFHYNATFPKDMYYYGTMPTGSHLATFYRSYLPLMQLFFYWGFLGAGAFSEGLMFWYKTVLIYSCLLPVLKFINFGSLSKRICVGLLTAITPFAFMYEMMESLSMDTFMAAVFGYALCQILYVRKRKSFNYACLILSLACLSLIKQISPIFTAVCLGTWLIGDVSLRLYRRKYGAVLTSYEESESAGKFRTDIIMMGVTGLISAAAYLSWKLFCSLKGNTVYLSGKLSDSVSGGLFKLPDYGQATIVNFLKSLFTCQMSLSGNGLPLILVVLAAIFVFVLITKNNPSARNLSAGFMVLLLGLVGYLFVLLYTYIFVFEQWEAESLSSIDRYFGTYATTLLIVMIYGIAMYHEKSEARFGSYAKWLHKAPILLAALMLITLPWGNLITCFVPNLYMMRHAAEYEGYSEAENEIKSLGDTIFAEGNLLYVTNESNTIYARASVYDLIPLVPAEMLVEEGTGDASETLLTRCRDENIYYVYFAGRLIDDEGASEQVSGALNGDCSLERGNMYYYDREAGDIKVLDLSD